MFWRELTARAWRPKPFSYNECMNLREFVIARQRLLARKPEFSGALQSVASSHSDKDRAQRLLDLSRRARDPRLMQLVKKWQHKAGFTHAIDDPFVLPKRPEHPPKSSTDDILKLIERRLPRELRFRKGNRKMPFVVFVRGRGVASEHAGLAQAKLRHNAHLTTLEAREHPSRIYKFGRHGWQPV